MLIPVTFNYKATLNNQKDATLKDAEVDANAIIPVVKLSAQLKPAFSKRNHLDAPISTFFHDGQGGFYCDLGPVNHFLCNTVVFEKGAIFTIGTGGSSESKGRTSRIDDGKTESSRQNALDKIKRYYQDLRHQDGRIFLHVFQPFFTLEIQENAAKPPGALFGKKNYYAALQTLPFSSADRDLRNPHSFDLNNLDAFRQQAADKGHILLPHLFVIDVHDADAVRHLAPQNKSLAKNGAMNRITSLFKR